MAVFSRLYVRFGLLPLSLMVLAGPVLPAHAAITNLETGETYRPTVEEDGTLEEPPDWVNSTMDEAVYDVPLGGIYGGGEDDDDFVPEVIADTDLCRSEVGDWLEDEPDPAAIVHTVLSDVRQDLKQEIGAFIHHQLLIETAGTGIVLGDTTVNRLQCDQCEMTYVACLLEGHGVDWCKLHTLNCPRIPTSDLSVTVPVIAPNDGELEFETSVSVRVETTEYGDLLLHREWCLTVERYETTGFGAFEGLVEDFIGGVLDDGRVCRDWPFPSDHDDE